MGSRIVSFNAVLSGVEIQKCSVGYAATVRSDGAAATPSRLDQISYFVPPYLRTFVLSYARTPVLSYLSLSKRRGADSKLLT